MRKILAALLLVYGIASAENYSQVFIQSRQLNNFFQNAAPVPARVFPQLQLPSPQERRRPFEEKEILIPTHNWTLKGNLTQPAAPSDTLIILVHGSGPNDMNHSIAGMSGDQKMTADGKPTKLFKDLNESFAANGFMVYRFNKRGVKGWNEEKQGPILDRPVYIPHTLEDLVKDVVAIVRHFRNSATPKRIILAGLSEGTVISPLAALEEKVDGLILMGSAANRVDKLIEYQFVERTLKWARTTIDEDKNGAISQAEALKYPAFSLDFDVVDKDKDGSVAIATELKEIMEETHKKTIEEWKGYPWYESHIRTAPNYETLPKFKGPILLIHGEADEQTPLSEAALLLQKLKDSGHDRYWFKSFPGLGHGFSPPLNGWQPTLGPMDKEALQSIGLEAAKRFGN